MVVDADQGVICTIIRYGIHKDELAFGFVVSPPIIVAVLAGISNKHLMKVCIGNAVIDFVTRRIGYGEIEMDFLCNTARGECRHH